MRPVNKGAAPNAYASYGDALDDLISRLGPYCSYCEQPITHGAEVEHVQPKTLVPELETSWDNFLLGCKSCNTVKGSKPVDLNGIAFPDMDNTFRGLTFSDDGSIAIVTGLTPDQTTLIEAVVRLVKLHRHDQNAALVDDRPTKRDRRAIYRRDAWMTAQNLLADYLEMDEHPTIANLIIRDIAPRTGFFSIWMTVFQNYPEMLNKFITAFPGTDASSFDVNGNSLHRVGGRF